MWYTTTKMNYMGDTAMSLKSVHEIQNALKVKEAAEAAKMYGHCLLSNNRLYDLERIASEMKELLKEVDFTLKR